MSKQVYVRRVLGAFCLCCVLMGCVTYLSWGLGWGWALLIGYAAGSVSSGAMRWCGMVPSREEAKRIMQSGDEVLLGVGTGCRQDGPFATQPAETCRYCSKKPAEGAWGYCPECFDELTSEEADVADLHCGNVTEEWWLERGGR
jgi:hypothetical protein